MGGAPAKPLHVQAALVAQAWPVQLLLESLRRQFGGLWSRIMSRAASRTLVRFSGYPA